MKDSISGRDTKALVFFTDHDDSTRHAYAPGYITNCSQCPVFVSCDPLQTFAASCKSCSYLMHKIRSDPSDMISLLYGNFTVGYYVYIHNSTHYHTVFSNLLKTTDILNCLLKCLSIISRSENVHAESTREL